ncbi:hypothetical protein [Roseivirga seohaensis]|uniref:hypothetical protein n=1 Tax=Roseivirga seohaensis TaxID=1914963 RepID=UPI003BA8C220
MPQTPGPVKPKSNLELKIMNKSNQSRKQIEEEFYRTGYHHQEDLIESQRLLIKHDKILIDFLTNDYEKTKAKLERKTQEAEYWQGLYLSQNPNFNQSFDDFKPNQ